MYKEKVSVVTNLKNNKKIQHDISSNNCQSNFFLYNFGCSVSNPYICEKCDYSTSKKSSYDKHLSCKKHIEKVSENNKMYICEFCHYNTSIKSNYDKHLSCKKHIEKVALETKKSKMIFSCDICDYTTYIKCNYKKHQKSHSTTNNIINKSKDKQCNANTNANVNTNVNTNANVNDYIINNNLYSSIMGEIKHLMIEQSTKFIQEQTKMYEEQTKINQIINDIANKQITSNNLTNNDNRIKNNQFNMNVFLNETCKDAMNISDFIKNLNVSMEDMEKTGELGFAKGMSRIIMNNLNAIEVCKRPIHCSDAKRETLYVKNNGVWEKETEERTKIKEVIYKVSCLNERQLIKWRDLPRNKGYHLSDHHKNDEFMNLVIEINKMRDEEIDKVITTISKHVTIDKVKMSGYLK